MYSVKQIRKNEQFRKRKRYLAYWPISNIWSRIKWDITISDDSWCDGRPAWICDTEAYSNVQISRNLMEPTIKFNKRLLNVVHKNGTLTILHADSHRFNRKRRYQKPPLFLFFFHFLSPTSNSFFFDLI